MVYVARRLCASAHLRPQVVKTRLQLQGELLAAGRAPAILYRGAHHVPRLNAPGNMRHTVILYSGAPLATPPLCTAAHFGRHVWPGLAWTATPGPRGVRRASWRVWRSRSGKPPLSRVILRVLGVLTVMTAIAPEGTLGR